MFLKVSNSVKYIQLSPKDYGHNLYHVPLMNFLGIIVWSKILGGGRVYWPVQVRGVQRDMLEVYSHADDIR